MYTTAIPRKAPNVIGWVNVEEIFIISLFDWSPNCASNNSALFMFVASKLLQKSEMRKNMVMDLIYRGFIYAANYSESHYNPRRSQIKTELRYLFVTTLNR